MLALSGVINAGMGVASSIGLMSLCGYIYNDIVSVMPILIVCKCCGTICCMSFDFTLLF